MLMTRGAGKLKLASTANQDLLVVVVRERCLCMRDVWRAVGGQHMRMFRGYTVVTLARVWHSSTS